VASIARRTSSRVDEAESEIGALSSARTSAQKVTGESPAGVLAQLQEIVTVSKTVDSRLYTNQVNVAPWVVGRIPVP